MFQSPIRNLTFFLILGFRFKECSSHGWGYHNIQPCAPATAYYFWWKCSSCQSAGRCFLSDDGAWTQVAATADKSIEQSQNFGKLTGGGVFFKAITRIFLKNCWDFKMKKKTQVPSSTSSFFSVINNAPFFSVLQLFVSLFLLLFNCFRLTPLWWPIDIC